MTIVSDFDQHGSPVATGATERMNGMYRWQRFIYDATRRYYLLGRDQMIETLQPAAAAKVLEIGCGTGRNLVCAAQKYPAAMFYGVDVSTEMLTSAMAAIARGGLQRRVRVAHGDATVLDPQTSFGIAQFDHVMISYSLSMIPAWRDVLDNAVACLAPGGRLHIVDFGSQERLPVTAGRMLMRWLALFDVTPRQELQGVLTATAAKHGAALDFQRPFRGYAQRAVMTMPAQLA